MSTNEYVESTPWVECSGSVQLKIVHLDTIIHATHLIGIAGSLFVPYELNHMNALDAFKTYYVNKFIDYHMHEIAF